MFSYNRLKSLRESKSISQKELAEGIGVSDVMVSMYEQGKKNPSIDTIAKISDYFGVSVDYLLGKEITGKDEKDIKKDLDKIMFKIRNGEDGPLHYNGEEIDPESLSLLEDAINLSLKQLKIINKEKYNPNKNKK